MSSSSGNEPGKNEAPLGQWVTGSTYWIRGLACSFLTVKPQTWFLKSYFDPLFSHLQTGYYHHLQEGMGALNDHVCAVS